MPKIQSMCSRQIVYEILKSGPKTRREVHTVLTDSPHPSYTMGTLGRVIGSLVNDGVVVKSREGTLEAVYRIANMDADVSDILTLPQTSKYVSWRVGHKKSGYNSKRLKKSVGRSSRSKYSLPERIYLKGMKDDGSRDGGIDWVDEPDSPREGQAAIWLRQRRVPDLPQKSDLALASSLAAFLGAKNK